MPFFGLSWDIFQVVREKSQIGQTKHCKDNDNKIAQPFPSWLKTCWAAHETAAERAFAVCQDDLETYWDHLPVSGQWRKEKAAQIWAMLVLKQQLGREGGIGQEISTTAI